MLIGIDAHNLEGNRTGVGRYLINLLQEWSKLNFQLILYFKKEIPNDIPSCDLFKVKLLNVGSTAKFIHWDLCQAARKDKVDILFCPGYVAPIFWRGKLALTLHDIIYEAHPEWFNWNSPADKILLKWVSKKSARKAQVIFVPSEFTRQEVIKHYRVAPEKVILTYLASDQNFSETGVGNIEAIKKKYRIEDKFVFYIGSIFDRRHLPEVIQAFGKLAAQRPDYQLLLAGKDYTRQKNIADLIVRLNDSLSREVVVRVDFIGDSDLKLLYSACAFFIWLSDYEGFGLPPLEAMQNGAPMITSGNTSLEEVAGEAALLIKDNFDVEEIYQAMRKVIENDNLRADLVKKGREQANKFSWQECAQLTLNVLLNS